jgi:hypothetical protein
VEEPLQERRGGRLLSRAVALFLDAGLVPPEIESVAERDHFVTVDLRRSIVTA